MKVWIVEMWDAGRGEWLPTTGAGLSRDDARREMQEWREQNYDDHFRITKYVRADAKAKRKGAKHD